MPLNKERNNMDETPTDQHGKQIISKCKSLSLRIINGRTKGDRAGEFTRFPIHRNERPSLIDYGLCNHTSFEKIISFNVQPYGLLSDHCCISLTVQARFSGGKMDTAPVKIINHPSS